jgi:ACS family glucarate transporter-like MFS transporter
LLFSETRVRWKIAALLLAVVTFAFITRLGMSYAAQRIQVEFGFSNVQIGWVLSAFIIGYGACQVPVGVLTDRWGPRRFLAAAVAGWSVLTLLTALAPRFVSAWWSPLGLLIVIRVCTGIAQAAALPCANKTVARWMPLAERAAGNSLYMTGVGIGGLLAPLLVVHLMLRYGWQAAFYLLGAAGLGIAALWFWYATDFPELHPWVSPAELALIRRDGTAGAPAKPAPTPWSCFLRSRGFWALAVSYGVGGYPSYVFYTWFYLYISNVRKVPLAAGSYWSMLPYLAIAVLTPLAGRISDRVTLQRGRRAGRLSVALAGGLLSGLLIVTGARVEPPGLAVICLALGAGFHLFGQTASWAAAIDLAPRHSATLFGLMNTLAQAAGAVAPVLTPMLAARFGWTRALDFAAAMVWLAGLLWIPIHPERPLTGKSG